MGEGNVEPKGGEYEAQRERMNSLVQEAGRKAMEVFDRELKAAMEEFSKDGAAKQSEQIDNDEAHKAIDEVLEASGKVDRRGNKLNSESVKNLFDLAHKDPERFTLEILELRRVFQIEGVEKGYVEAQDEIIKLLDGKTTEAFLKEQQEKIDALKSDWVMEKAAIVVKLDGLSGQEKADEEERLNSGRLAEIGAQLAEEKRKYDLVNNLQLGAEAKPILPKIEEPDSDLSEKGERNRRTTFEIKGLNPNSNVYDTEAKVRRSAIERAVQYFADEDSEAILQQLAEVETKEQESRKKTQDDFETSSGEGSEKDIEEAAKVAGGSSLRPPRTEEQARREYRAAMSRMAREAVPGRLDPEVAKIYAEEREKQEYYNNLSKWAEEEAKNPNKNRFGDPELPDEREKRVGGIFSRLRGKILPHWGGNKSKEEKEEKEEKPEPKTTVNYGPLGVVLSDMLSGK